jgi:hypothetical protein
MLPDCSAENNILKIVFLNILSYDLSYAKPEVHRDAQDYNFLYIE